MPSAPGNENIEANRTLIGRQAEQYFLCGQGRTRNKEQEQEEWERMNNEGR